jgi:exodeoxyribonuclease VII large subunit
MERKHTALDRLAPRLSGKPLRVELRHAQDRLAAQIQRLQQVGGQLTLSPRRHWEQLGKLLETLSYRNVLARGYALVQDEAGQVVSSRAAAGPGDGLRLTFVDGELGVTVNGAPVGRRKSPRSGSDDGSQESLF